MASPLGILRRLRQIPSAERGLLLGFGDPTELEEDDEQVFRGSPSFDRRIRRTTPGRQRALRQLAQRTLLSGRPASTQTNVPQTIL